MFHVEHFLILNKIHFNTIAIHDFSISHFTTHKYLHHFGQRTEIATASVIRHRRFSFEDNFGTPR